MREGLSVSVGRVSALVREGLSVSEGGSLPAKWLSQRGLVAATSSQGHHGLPLHRRRATSGSGSLLNSALASSQGHERYERRDGALFFEVRPVWPVGRS